MTELFLHVVNISISASWLVLAVLLARLVLKRAPKWAHVLLWGIVGVRLIFPFSLESALSLIPSAETISPTILTDGIHRVYTGFPTLNQSINPVLSQAATSTTDAAPNLLEIWLPVLAVLWFFGVAALLAWSAISYLHLRQRVATAVRLEDNLYQSEAVLSPFVLGLVHPCIYLPFYLDQDTMEHSGSEAAGEIGAALSAAHRSGRSRLGGGVRHRRGVLSHQSPHSPRLPHAGTQCGRFRPSRNYGANCTDRAAPGCLHPQCQPRPV